MACRKNSKYKQHFEKESDPNQTTKTYAIEANTSSFDWIHKGKADIIACQKSNTHLVVSSIARGGYAIVAAIV